MLLSCDALSKFYGRTRALDTLNLSLEAGEPIALIGPNGAGKTTLLSLLCGYIRPSSGRAQVLGHDPGSQALIGRLSALPQDAAFDPHFSMQRQLRFYAELQGMSRREAKLDVERVLGTVQLTDASHQKPDTLSHGMRKRMALAQALLGTPELVLLDEPTAGIDPPNVKIIRDLIRSDTTGATFIISSHNLDELEKLCGSVVYLSEGRLQQSGPLDSTDDTGYLTVRLQSVPEQAFLEACRGLSGVQDVQRQAQGDFTIRCDAEGVVDQALLAMLAEKGWRYRHLIRGRSLEERLYG